MIRGLISDLFIMAGLSLTVAGTALIAGMAVALILAGAELFAVGILMAMNSEKGDTA